MNQTKVTTLGQYRTVAGWAEAFGVSEEALERFIRNHKVAVVKLGSTPLLTLEALGSYRVRIDKLRKLLEAGE